MEKYLFTFEWTDDNKSANDYIRDWCKEHHIQFRYNGFFQLVADVYHQNNYTEFCCEHVSGDLYGVMIKCQPVDNNNNK